MILIDTSTVVAWLDESHPDHLSSAAAVREALVEDDLAISVVTLAELAAQAGVAPEEALRRLEAKGIQGATLDRQVQLIADDARVTPARVYEILGNRDVPPVAGTEAGHSAKGPGAGFAKRAAINAPIQGTAADVIRRAMIRMPAAIKDLDAKMLLQVHDELLFEVSESDADRLIPIAKEIMEQASHPAVSLKVHLAVEAGKGKNWAEAH